MVAARRFALPLAAAALALAAWCYRHHDLPFVILFGDEAEYTEIGRRIATGRGFTTGVVFPIELAEYGADERHPSLLRPPLWPLVLAGSFAVGGANEAAAHAAVAFCYVALVALVALTAVRLAGPWAGMAAGVATVLAADVSLYASLASTETLTALCVSAWLLLAASGAHPAAVGAACGLAYLARYNLGILLPLSLAALWLGGPDRVRRTLACAGGFALVCAPWWIRNAAITGNPFFSYYRITLWETPQLVAWNGSLLNNLRPGPESPAWISLPEKLRILLPMTLAIWPVPAANLPAFAGALLGALKRERACLLLLAALLANKLAVVPFAVRGRYEIPFAPAAIAVGVAAWWRYGGRLRIPALIAVLAAPWLPTLPTRDAREDFHRSVLEEVRRRERLPGGVRAWREARLAPQRACLAGLPLLIADDAPTVAWDWDTVVLFTPQSHEELWEILARHPVRAAVMEAPKHSDRSKFLRLFAPRPECGPDVYVRRGFEAGGAAYAPTPSLRSAAAPID